jgi:predicted Zn-ribbon and HTH transcriptional regulator
MEARLTLPRALLAALDSPLPKNLEQLSSELHVSMKVLPGALEKLSRSLRHSGRKLVQQPAACLACGFTFEERTRFQRPSRCPRCSSERIQSAAFRVE